MLGRTLCSIAVFCFAAVSSELSLPEIIDFKNPTPGPAEKSRTATGGKYTSNGWEVTDKRGRIAIQLANPFAANSEGAIEFEASNFDPFGMQNLSTTLTKHLTFCGYGLSHGNQEKITNGQFMFQLRTHPNYKWRDGRNNAKMMTFKWATQSAGDLLGERHWLGYPIAWDKTKTYTFRIEWTSTRFKVYLPTGQSYVFAKLPHTKGLEYIFLGRDNTTYATYITTVGFQFRRILIYRDLQTRVVRFLPSIESGQPPERLAITDVAGRMVRTFSSDARQNAWIWYYGKSAPTLQTGAKRQELGTNTKQNSGSDNEK